MTGERDVFEEAGVRALEAPERPRVSDATATLVYEIFRDAEAPSSDAERPE